MKKKKKPSYFAIIIDFNYNKLKISCNICIHIKRKKKFRSYHKAIYNSQKKKASGYF